MVWSYPPRGDLGCLLMAGTLENLTTYTLYEMSIAISSKYLFLSSPLSYAKADQLRSRTIAFSTASALSAARRTARQRASWATILLHGELRKQLYIYSRSCL